MIRRAATARRSALRRIVPVLLLGTLLVVFVAPFGGTASAHATLTSSIPAADETTARLEATLAERDAAIARLEAAVDEARARAEQLEVETANSAGERHDLVAQLEAERAIHEALRQDMTGRIEAASSGRGRARSAV